MDASLQLLSEIYEVGERMCAALEDGDLDGFTNLVQQRGTLMDALNPATALKGGGEWEEMAARLRRQHEVLQVLIGRYESQTQETLEGINRFKDARKSYAGAQARPGILDNRLRG